MRSQPIGLLIIFAVICSLSSPKRSEATTTFGVKYYPYMAELGRRNGICETFRDLYDFYNNNNFDEEVEVFIKQFHQDNLHKMDAKSEDDFWDECEKMKEFDEQHRNNDFDQRNHSSDKKHSSD